MFTSFGSKYLYESHVWDKWSTPLHSNKTGRKTAHLQTFFLSGDLSDMTLTKEQAAYLMGIGNDDYAELVSLGEGPSTDNIEPSLGAVSLWIESRIDNARDYGRHAEKCSKALPKPIKKKVRIKKQENELCIQKA